MEEVKCNTCGREWKPIKDVIIDNCPRCSIPHEVINAIIKGKGEHLFGTYQLKGFLSDFLPMVRSKQQKMFKQIIDEQMDLKLYYLIKKGACSMEINSNCLGFIENNGYDESVWYVLNCFLYAMGNVDLKDIEKDHSAVKSTSLTPPVFPSVECVVVPCPEITIQVTPSIKLDNIKPLKFNMLNFPSYHGVDNNIKISNTINIEIDNMPKIDISYKELNESFFKGLKVGYFSNLFNSLKMKNKEFFYKMVNHE